MSLSRLQDPRPLSQLDLEKVLATSKKTQVAAGEYSLSSQSSAWRGSREPDEVQAAISGISKLLVSQIINLQSESQDSWQRDPEEDSR
jgi:hypothetical protein